ncbi:MAG: prolyl oligopeptidase family serine peptidase [Proteobacteria bacterium]|nr:prolyl oligopeptidase family serine peptidase [Pseudomonadota bacterium]
MKHKLQTSAGAIRKTMWAVADSIDAHLGRPDCDAFVTAVIRERGFTRKQGQGIRLEGVRTRGRRNGAAGRLSARGGLGFPAVWVTAFVYACGGVASGSPAQQGRPWTVGDIVQIRRIEGTAVLGSSQVAAFIVEAPSLADDRNHYALYKVSPGNAPRLLVRAAFMRNLEWRPGTMDWTMRADFGHGVQLYEVTEAGLVKPLLVVKPAVIVGGYDGLISGDETEPRETGVLSYQWAPDGRHFWYSRVRLRSAEQAKALSHGIVYDDATMSGLMPPDFRRQIHYSRSELHAVDVQTGADQLVASDSVPIVDGFNFRYSYHSVQWVDSSILQYRLLSFPNGYWTNTLRRFDLVNGKAGRIQMPFADLSRVAVSVPVPNGFITWRKTARGARLQEVTAAGKVVRDFGPANFRYLSPGGVFFRGGTWMDRDGHHWIFAVSHQGGATDGLVFFPSTPADRQIQNVKSSLNDCAFNTKLTWGICNRESLTQPPELVSVSPSTGKVGVLARPDARYENIAPLRSVALRWRNRFGYSNTGYVTYPRGYISGRAYPAILVTHSINAANLFAWDGFQWEFPIQVFAEEGYLVLSVNEPKPPRHAAPPPYLKGAASSSRTALWFSNFIDQMSSMEAAVDSLVKAGLINPTEVGLCGYSRGEELSSFIMTHSRVFRAASFGDDTLYDAGNYWGGLFIRRQYDNLFGGSPFDPKAFPNYLKYSPSARASDFAGPVLQQESGYVAYEAGELNELLLEARIPTELVSYPHEAHIFYDPRDRAMAMRRNLDWFNYWLRGRRALHPADQGEYARWDAMANRWAACKSACRAKLGFPAASVPHTSRSGHPAGG